MKQVIFNRLIVFMLAIIPIISVAQINNSLSGQLSSEDSSAVYALVLYPDSVRLSIFEACKYPELIVRINNLQQKTSNEFSALLQYYTKEEQEAIWDLTRYPELLNRITAGGEKTRSELKVIAENYPAEIQDNIVQFGGSEFQLLSQIHNLENTSAQQFDQIVKSYPAQVQHAYVELLGYPEIMSLLNDHLNMAVLVGDMYKKDPAALIHTADSMSLVAARQYSENIEAWKKALQDNPQAKEDLKASAEEYAKDNGYDEDEYSTAPSEYYIEHYVCYSYSYWFGYPYWYPYHYWYPYPWWYDWGFYYDIYGNMIIIGPPSWYFTYWYFYYPHHYYYHPYLADVYVGYYYGYYYGPRTYVDENTNIVHNWVNDRKDFLPDNFITDPGKRVDVIRQTGIMETEYRNYQAEHPASTDSRDEYMRDHKSDFPDLQVPEKQDQRDQDKYPVITPPKYEPPVKQPPVKVPDTKQQKKDGIQIYTPQYDFNKVNRAQKLHKTVWTEPKKRGGR